MTKNERESLLLKVVELGLKIMRTPTVEDSSKVKAQIESTLKSLNLSLGQALIEVETILLKKI